MGRLPAAAVRTHVEDTIAETFDRLAHEVWRAHGAGEIEDAQAQDLAELLTECGRPIREAMPRPISLHALRPSLPAIEIQPRDGSAGWAVAWCPWHETLLRQHPGEPARAVPSPGTADPASPVPAGYRLTVTGSAPREHDAVPDGPLVFQRRMRDALAAAAGGLQRHLLQALVGRCQHHGGVFSRAMRKGRLLVFALHRRWLITRPRKPDIEGHGGMLQLARDLYGVSAGVAGVRILEAATGEMFDAEAARSVQRVIDDWMGRGAPARTVR